MQKFSKLTQQHIEFLRPFGCSRLYNIQLLDEPRDEEHLKKLCMGEAPIHSLSISSMGKRLFTWPLHWLYSRAHKNSVSYLLPSSNTFHCMHLLDLSFCKLLQIPDAIANLGCLERLNLRGNNFATQPKTHLNSKNFKCFNLKFFHFQNFVFG